MLSTFKNIYYALPPWSVAFLSHIPDRFLFGKHYVDAEVSTDTKNLGLRLSRQLEYVREHTRYGHDHIPAEFAPDEAEALLETLPTLTADDIVDNLDYFSSDEYSSLNSYLATTGGTGRNPTTIRLSNESYATEWAHIHWIWHHCGYVRKEDLKLTLRGYHLPKGTYFKYNPLYNELMLDSFQINDLNFDRILSKLKRYPISCIHGYPSLVKIFMERLQTLGESLRVKGVFLGSEEASVNFKHDVAEFFNATVLSWYGQSEKVILAADLEKNGKFVNLATYGYPAIINADDSGFGEIVGTTFVNQALPLIRYRTGDFGRLEKKGKQWFIEDIRGRWGKDFVYLSPGERFPTTAINMHSSVQQKILFFQIIQEKYAELTVLILPKSAYMNAGNEIIREFESDFGEKLKRFKLHYQIVTDENAILRSARGKKIMLVQKLNPPRH